MSTVEGCLDVLGVGFGPANIALAIALRESESALQCHFIEKQPGPYWQHQMLIEHSDIQNVPFRDLITPINPQSHFSFINFLHKNGRFFEYMNLMKLYPLREDYFQYIKWCADHFAPQVDYQAQAVAIHHQHDPWPHYCVQTQDGRQYCARSLVFATGRTPNIPPAFNGVPASRAPHLTQYQHALEPFLKDPQGPYRFAVVGASQSAVEIILDLNARFTSSSVTSFNRNFSFRQKDLSSFSYEMLFPDFTDHFYERDEQEKKAIREYLKTTNYSSVDRDILDQLYLEMYRQKITDQQRVFCHKNRLIDSVTECGDRVNVVSQDRYSGQCEQEQFDLVVLATGFKDFGHAAGQERCPELLNQVMPLFRLKSSGQLDIRRDYSLCESEEHNATAPLYLNGLCESSHGFGDAGSISLLSYRAQTILNSLQHRLTVGHANEDNVSATVIH